MLRKARRRPTRRLLLEALESRRLMDAQIGIEGQLVVDPPLPPFHSTVPAERLDRLSRGINLSGWFRYPEEQTEAWFTGHVTDADLTLIRDLGFQHVRLPVWPSLIFDPGEPNLVDATMLGYLETAVTRILAHDLAVVIDLHDEEMLLEGSAAIVDDFVEFWGDLAGELASFDPDCVFFEVINEPVFNSDLQAWFPIQTRILAAMRAAAPQHTLIATGPGYSHAENLVLATPVADTNVVYNFHFYYAFLFTHQGATWTDPSFENLRGLPYPSTPANVAALAAQLQKRFPSEADRWMAEVVREYGQERWNAAKIEAEIRQAVDWAEANGVTLYAGEYGVHRDGGVKSADRNRWHHDVTSILSKYDIGWSMWAYDDNFGLIGPGQPAGIQVGPPAAAGAGRVMDVSLARALGLDLPSLAPVNQLPSGLTVKEDTKLVFNSPARALKITNPNKMAFPVEVTLSVTSGVFTLAKRTGLTFVQGDGTADAVMQFRGSAAAVKAALANASFLAARDYLGTAEIAFTSRLVGASLAGSLGAPAADTDVISINVLPVNDAPVLTPGSFQLPAAFVSATPHAGIAVGDLLAGRVSDADPGALRGIALASIGSANKAGWEFSLDGGATWQKVNSSSSTSALLLRDVDRLRFVGSLSAGPIKFAAWDQTTGTAGGRANLTASRTGGATAYSTGFATGKTAPVIGGPIVVTIH